MKAIAFAGAAGCGKTPVATNLSWQLGWGVFSTDAIRSELSETWGYPVLNQPEFKEFRDQRFLQALNLGNNLIIDASVDRTWEQKRAELAGRRAEFFIISFDLKEDFLEQLFKIKGYAATEYIPGWVQDHQNFLNKYGQDVGFRVNEENYPDRINLCYRAVRAWLDKS